MDFYAKLVAFAPLVSFAIVGGLNRLLPKGVSAWTACAGVFVSFLAAVMVFSHIWSSEEPHVVLVYDWITSGTFDSQFSFLIDRLSATFILMITGVSFLIHVFSVGYMWEDDGIRRFFAYLNLFVFFMLILILADNFLVTFIGWEGVGFCSFMLISFWYKDMKNNDAAKKAFVMNRIGDFGFLMAMCLMVLHLGTLNYPEILSAEGLATLQKVPGGILSLIALCLLLGAAGKSAQIPLYTWLPDAMAAPTPVSALIHAATMVTAGVYLVARTHVFFEASPEVSIVVAWVGVATA
ncbi:MAG: proton-conducting transporter membrane subunit, partial [Bacteroidota bacterium]